MIRMQYRKDLPMLACVAQEGDLIVLAVNPDLQAPLSRAERLHLFNTLMAEIEHQRGRVIDITLARQRRELSRRFVGDQRKETAHGMDQIPAQR